MSTPKSNLRTALQRKEKSRQPVHYFDPESEGVVDVPLSVVERYERRIMSLARNQLGSAIDLAVIADEKLYHGGGYASFKDFATHSPVAVGYRQAKKYVKVGRELIASYGSAEEAENRLEELRLEGTSQKALEGEGAGPAPHELGIEKMYRLSMFGGDTLKSWLEDAVVRRPDGEVIPAAVIFDMAAKEISEDHTRSLERGRKLEADNARHQETIKRMKSEHESELRARAERDARSEEAYREGSEMQQMWGPPHRSHEAKKTQLQRARNTCMDLREELLGHGLELGAEDMASLKGQLIEIVRELHSILHTAEAVYADAIHTAPDTIASRGLTQWIESGAVEEIMAQENPPQQKPPPEVNDDAEDLDVEALDEWVIDEDTGEKLTIEEGNRRYLAKLDAEDDPEGPEGEANRRYLHSINEIPDA